MWNHDESPSLCLFSGSKLFSSCSFGRSTSVRPAHAASVYEHFYFLGGFSPTIMYALGGAELLLLIGLSSASRRG
jgi:hypothetical protein